MRHPPYNPCWRVRIPLPPTAGRCTVNILDTEDTFPAIACASAADFLLNIRGASPTSPNSNGSSGWMFRGHRDAQWVLLPSLHRAWPPNSVDDYRAKVRKNIAKHFAGIGRPLPDLTHLPSTIASERLLDALACVEAERVGVNGFCDLANDVGLTAPVWVPTTEPFCEDGVVRKLRDHEYWPPPDGADLAQHHGVPTRLLDWTTRPLMAAFFCVRHLDGLEPQASSSTPSTRPSHMAVWGVQWTRIGWVAKLEHDAVAAGQNRHKLQLVRRPGTSNPYLGAQKGVFTRDPEAELQYIATGKWPSQLSRLIGSALPGPPPVAKWTLPTTEAEKLLKLLEHEHVTRAHLMPSYDICGAMTKVELEGMAQLP